MKRQSFLSVPARTVSGVLLLGLFCCAVAPGVIAVPAARPSVGPSAGDPLQAARHEASRLMRAAVFAEPGVGTLPYRIYAPQVPAGTKIPCVLFLHGAGERGTNNIAQLKHGVPAILGYARAHGGAVVIAPQCPDGPFGKGWVDCDWRAKSHTMAAEPSVPFRLAWDLLSKVLAEHPEIDLARVYVTGISMGGYGTWEMLARHGGTFAAAVPICGGGDLAQAPRITGMKIRVFHGGADSCVPTSRSVDMAAAVKEAGGDAELHVYPGVDHDCWTRTYADTSVLDWLFGQRCLKKR